MGVPNSFQFDLGDFSFDAFPDQLGFLRENPDVLAMLPAVGARLKKAFGEDARLSLELFQEGDWKTLFVNVHTDVAWATSSNIVHSLLVDLFKAAPQVAEKLNVGIDPHGI